LAVCWPDERFKACEAGETRHRGILAGFIRPTIYLETFMSSFLEAIENITPEIYESLKLAVEIGKWPDGRKLTQEQKELSLQAMIAWEMQNLPEEERTGYMGPQECKSKSEPVPNLLFKSTDTLH
jgi:hypothetical protein